MLNGLVCGDELLTVKKERRREYIINSVNKTVAQAYVDTEGWEIDRELKTKTRIKKRKSEDEIFENKVWLLFSQMGFEVMNEDRNFTIPYSKDGQLTKQIDVFAMDEETILLVECKKSLKKNQSKEFKTELESINGNMDGLRLTLTKEYPGKKLKYIFATEDYNIGEADMHRMAEFGIEYFDEEKVKYYTDLGNHLGNAARYQLLGNLFRGMKIPELKSVVPAIKGVMGGHTYYSFSIEPDILLKLGYVLHRNDSNRDSMPTYQRIIKKGRLEGVQDFIEGGGYFPNSIIVSIDTGKKKKPLNFEQAAQGKSESKSKIGLLHLPQVYRSVYIIDGQHRLYGYSNSDYRFSETIPVVAFENLDQEEQIKIFMDINENQKAVPKNLRNTLDEDLKYDSDDPKERRQALSLKIARELGEDRNSPLYDRVVIGENTTTEERCITLEVISKAILESNLLSKFKKAELASEGIIDLDNNDKTFLKLYPLLVHALCEIEKRIGISEWSKGNSDKAAFVRNNMISGYIRFINSALEFINVKEKIKTSPSDQIEKKLDKFISIIADFWNSSGAEVKQDLGTAYGAGGPIKVMRTFEREVNSKIPAFLPDGFAKYWEDRNEKNASDAKTIFNNMLSHLKEYCKDKLDCYYGIEDDYEKWFSEKVFKGLEKKVVEKNYGKSKVQYIDHWDLVGFSELRDVILNKTHWTEVFNKEVGWSTDDKGDRSIRTKWLLDLDEIKKKLNSSNVISVDDFEYLKDIDKWLQTLK